MAVNAMGTIIKDEVNFFSGAVFVSTAKYIFLFFRRAGGHQLNNVGKHFLVLIQLQSCNFSQEKTHVEKDQSCKQAHQILHTQVSEN